MIKIIEEYPINCPEGCKHKDIMCQECVDGNYYDENAQD